MTEAALGACPDCGGPMAEVGPPINDIYCGSVECNQAAMRRSILARREQHERAEFVRLKAKYADPT